MFIGTQEVLESKEKDGRINYKLANGTSGSATKRQFDAMATDKAAASDDQLVIMIAKHTHDVADVLNAIYACNLNYNEAQFVIQRAVMSLTELQESAICKVVGDAFNNPIVKLEQANNIPIKELNEKVK